MGVHDGHRQRLKKRFAEQGLDGFNELNALELLLFYAIPRRDTNEIAHALLERFGSLAGVFDASVKELTEVDGISENSALLMQLIPQIMRKSLASRTEERPVLKSSREAGTFLIPKFMYHKEEFLLVLCLDANKRLISCSEIGRGVVDSVAVNVRMVAELALKNRASSVILAHNHPDCKPYPSAEDDRTTKAVFQALDALGIPLDDHIIVSGDAYISYASSGLYDMIKR